MKKNTNKNLDGNTRKNDFSRPNIILILADDMGYSDIGCFGGEIKTPNLDGMAATGIRMSQFYNTARCCPSRASLLTGLNPHQAGIGHMINDYGYDGYRGYLNASSVTIAEVLSTNGYRTQMSGKWHVGGEIDIQDRDSWSTAGEPGKPTPTQRGFQHYFGTLSGGGNYFNPRTLMKDESFIDSIDDDFYYTDEISNHAVEMIRDSAMEKRPFFSYIAYTAPHWPLHAREEDIGMYEDTYLKGWDEFRTARHESLKDNGVLSDEWEITARDVSAPPWESIEHKIWEAQRMAVYAAQVSSLDRGVGKIINELKNTDQFDNTLIIFLSDNGGCAEYLTPKSNSSDKLMFDYTLRDGTLPVMGNVVDLKPGSENTFQSYDLPWANVSNSPFRLYKHWLHEGGISSPCVIQWPKRIKGSAISHQPAQLMDLTATIFDAANTKYPKEYEGNVITPCEGESFLSIIDGTNWSKSTPLFWEHEGNCAVREGDWKLVRRFNHDWELYNLESDRTETVNLASTERIRVERMAELWQKWADNSNVMDWPVNNYKMGAAPVQDSNVHGVG